MRCQSIGGALFAGLLALAECVPLSQHNGNSIVVKPHNKANAVFDEPADAPDICGESGEFVMDFDGLPSYTPNSNDISAFRPIFNPNSHFFFSGGWFYTPSTDIYHPASGKYLAVFDPSKGAAPGSPYAGLLSKGGYGAGPRAYMKTFWFDAYSAHVGCGNRAQGASCTVTVSAVKYSAKSKKEETTSSATFSVPSCPGREKCRLTRIELGDGFRGLSGIVFKASVGGKPVTLFVDKIAMNWHDNSCEAGLERVRSR